MQHILILERCTKCEAENVIRAPVELIRAWFAPASAPHSYCALCDSRDSGLIYIMIDIKNQLVSSN